MAIWGISQQREIMVFIWSHIGECVCSYRASFCEQTMPDGGSFPQRCMILGNLGGCGCNKECHSTYSLISFFYQLCCGYFSSIVNIENFKIYDVWQTEGWLCMYRISMTYVCLRCMSVVWCVLYMHEFRHLLCCSLLISHCIDCLVVIEVLSSLRCKGGLLDMLFKLWALNRLSYSTFQHEADYLLICLARLV